MSVILETYTMDTVRLNGSQYIVKEGLIRTYPIKNVVDCLARVLNLSQNNNDILNIIKGKIDKDGYIGIARGRNNTEAVKVIVEDIDINISLVDKYMNKWGWFIGYKGDVGYGYCLLQYEKKFDTDVTDFVMKKGFLYHIAPLEAYAKIKSIGLVPKDSTWQRYLKFRHKGRIYLFTEELSEDEFERVCADFIKNKINSNDGFVLLKVDANKMTNSPKFYADPRMGNAVYTLDNISPDTIEIVRMWKNE